MKKKIISVLLLTALCFLAIGCQKKENEEMVGGWTIDLAAQSLAIPKEAANAFNKAIEKENNLQLEPIALLGTQVVAGTNYMFLCTETPMNKTEDSSYKIAIVYKDLKGEAILFKKVDFDVNQYAGKEIKKTSESLMGGWQVNTDMQDPKIQEEIKDAFDKATSEDTVIYTPIVVLAKQVVAGTNYAIMTQAEDAEENFSIEVLTIYKDLQGNAKVISSAYVNLADYNK